MNHVRKVAQISCCTAAIVAFFALPQAKAQDRSPQTSVRLSFDVSSIREWRPGEGPKGAYAAGVQVLPGRVSGQCSNLNSLLFFAFHLTWSSPVVGLPAWGHAACGGGGYTNTFKIDATMPPGTTDVQARQMMQSLLADRFKLAFHWEKKNGPIYGLVIASGGFKLKPSDPRNDPPRALHSIGCPSDDRACHIMVMGSVPISEFAGSLGGIVGRPVIDKTGLSGTYYMDLKWAGDTSPDSPLPSLPAALKENFGLELKSETGEINVLVIDHVEKPSPN